MNIFQHNLNNWNSFMSPHWHNKTLPPSTHPINILWLPVVRSLFLIFIIWYFQYIVRDSELNFQNSFSFNFALVFLSQVNDKSLLVFCLSEWNSHDKIFKTNRRFCYVIIIITERVASFILTGRTSSYMCNMR